MLGKIRTQLTQATRNKATQLDDQDLFRHLVGEGSVQTTQCLSKTSEGFNFFKCKNNGGRERRDTSCSNTATHTRTHRLGSKKEIFRVMTKQLSMSKTDCVHILRLFPCNLKYGVVEFNVKCDEIIVWGSKKKTSHNSIQSVVNARRVFFLRGAAVDIKIA